MAELPELQIIAKGALTYFENFCSNSRTLFAIVSGEIETFQAGIFVITTDVNNTKIFFTMNA